MKNHTETPNSKYQNPMADWLRQAADRHERTKEPVWAILYRNEACRMERESQ